MSGELFYDPKTLDILQKTDSGGPTVKYNIHKPEIRQCDLFIVGQQAHGCSRDFILADKLIYSMQSGVNAQGITQNKIDNDLEFANYIWEVFKRLFYNGILKNIKELCSNELLQELKNTDFLLKKGQEEIKSLNLFSYIKEHNVDVNIIVDNVEKGLSVFSALFFAYSVHIISDFFYSVDQQQSFRPLDKIFPYDNPKYLELLKLIIKKKELEDDGSQIDSFKLEYLVRELKKNESPSDTPLVKIDDFSNDLLKRFIRFCYAKFFNSTSILEIIYKEANDTIEIILFLFLLYLISDPYVKLKDILLSSDNVNKLLKLNESSKNVYNSLIGKYCVPKLESFLNGFELNDEETEILGEKILNQEKIDNLLRTLGSKENNRQYVNLEDNSEEAARLKAAADAAMKEAEEFKKLSGCQDFERLPPQERTKCRDDLVTEIENISGCKNYETLSPQEREKCRNDLDKAREEARIKSSEAETNASESGAEAARQEAAAGAGASATNPAGAEPPESAAASAAAVSASPKLREGGTTASDEGKAGAGTAAEPDAALERLQQNNEESVSDGGTEEAENREQNITIAAVENAASLD